MSSSSIRKTKIINQIVNLRKAVKSSYIIDNIFSYLNLRTKLILIIYNKKYQNQFGINIEKYKEISGKYIIKENGNVKEYELGSNKLLYEGEYKNGRRNGKGKEYYDNGKIKFEGEYLNGKIIYGKGFDLFGNNNLIINKNGKGKEYYKDNKIKFEGEYKNGKKWNGKDIIIMKEKKNMKLKMEKEILENIIVILLF